MNFLAAGALPAALDALVSDIALYSEAIYSFLITLLIFSIGIRMLKRLVSDTREWKQYEKDNGPF